MLSNREKIFTFCCYLPSSNYSNEIYAEYMNTLQAIYNTYSEIGSSFIIGDLNAEVISPNLKQNSNISFRNKSFSDFLIENNLMSICYSKHRKGPSYTFTTMEKMLDHILIPKMKISEVTCVEILDDPTYNCSDHIPIVAKFSF